MSTFVDWRKHAGSETERFYKTTLWTGEHMMAGLNCLEPGQVQKVHAHENADKLYFVLEGEGTFSIGDEQKNVASGGLAIAPAGVPHGVTNNNDHRLSLLVIICPPIK